MRTLPTRATTTLDLTRTILHQPGVLAAFVLLCALLVIGTRLVARNRRRSRSR